MLQPPDIELADIAAVLRAAYGVQVNDIVFLPVGADPDAAAWRVTIAGGPPFFLKTKFGPFDRAVLAVPRLLHDAGIREVLAPLLTRDGALSVAAGGTTLILYPYVDGRNGFDVTLTPKSWTALGAAIRRIHETRLPAGLADSLDTERFGSRWRDSVSRFMGEMANVRGDGIASELAALLSTKRDDIAVIVRRAAGLADAVRDKHGDFALCHTDLHAGNVLIGTDGSLHIVDWDSPRLAPKERDLMFIGGGVGGVWNEPEEAAAFYDGYGTAEIDTTALAYYRYERIVEDIAVTCEQVFLGDGDNRAENLAQLVAQWRPRDVIAMARSAFAVLERPPV